MICSFVIVIFLLKIQVCIRILHPRYLSLIFFYCLNNDIRKYSDKGYVFLLGDFNARTGELPDYIPNLQLDRFIDLPEHSSRDDVPYRHNHDKLVNDFGQRLLDRKSVV